MVSSTDLVYIGLISLDPIDECDMLRGPSPSPILMRR